ncbi:MAG: DUF255 domain-containing protein [Candidatus Lokiarchaeota archaeon]|nr:DUF255 domain-containing protein [Candidatus Lokiarchaeota archaeon]MBD3201419.1 DUF255 domain-containing protein [Candidatus Lokiarchaeota archaeon]
MKKNEDEVLLNDKNKLAFEKSPYLLQHAENPVEWYPWGEEAFQKAKEEDKPIFLSIGYSTCHWCHVMAHESFEDAQVAELMNETFVSIKVDREERPDIDKIYMTVCQLMTGSGGWPLTIIMTPEKKPFFAGTYFPKETRFNRIGLIDLIMRIRKIWKEKREDLERESEQIIHAMKNSLDEAPGDQLDKYALKTAYNQLSMQFDQKKGGFRNAPKFPMPHNLMFLLRMWNRTKKEDAIKMVKKTLDEMRNGGIYDHIGFGFHRYSTDNSWLVPHFEKMLYDQALLALSYLEAYQATDNKMYAETAREIFTYVLRDMTSSEGGFYSAEDADSEGVEGKFYVWSWGELKDILEKEDFELFIKTYNIEKEGNYLEESTKEKTGNNILHRTQSYPELAELLGLELEEYKLNLELIRKRLFEYREKRNHPHKDDKILSDWNGLMIAALAKGARVLKDQKYAKAASNAVEFILQNLRDNDGLLLHRYREGTSDITGYLDDYSFLIWGLIELYEATFNTEYLGQALELTQIQIQHYWDRNIGGFYFTSDIGEKLLVRQKEIYDGAIPSGNSVAMLNLLRLSYLTGNTELEKKADYISRVFADSIRNNPTSFTQLLIAVDFAIGPSYTLVIAGDEEDEKTNQLIDTINSNFLPNKSFIFRPTDKEEPTIDKLANYIQYFTKQDDFAAGYVCVNKTCKKPTSDINEILEFMNTQWN